MHGPSPFPLFDDASKFDRKQDAFAARFGLQATERMRRVQPFHAQPPTDDPLQQLHDLWNFHKHRALHVAAAAPYGFEDLKIECEGGSRIEWKSHIARAGETIARIRPLGSGHVRLMSDPTIHWGIVFTQTTAALRRAYEKPMYETVEDAVARVETDVLPLFEKLFS